MIRGTSSSSHLKKGSSDATTLLQGGSWISKFAPDTSYPIFSNIFREPFEQHTLQLHSLPFFFASFGSILYCTNMACQGPGYQPPIIGFQSTVIFSFDISPKRVFRRTCNIPQLKHSSTKRIKVVPGPKAKSLCKARIHQWGIQFGTQKTA